MVDYSIIAIISIVLFFFYMVYREHSRNVRAAANRPQPRIQKEDINTQIDNAKLGLKEAQKTYQEMAAKGATPEQLKPLKERIDNLQLVVNNEWVIKTFAPYADDIIKTVMKWFK